MKIEFGVDVTTREIVLADVIDKDSWRLWPSGSKPAKRRQTVISWSQGSNSWRATDAKEKFWVGCRRVELLLKPESQCRVIVLMGSTSDLCHCEKIEGLWNFWHSMWTWVTSAHKGPDETLRIKAEYEGDGIPTVFVAVAGRSNGLGPVLSGNTAYPVISCPPLTPDLGLRCGLVITQWSWLFDHPFSRRIPAQFAAQIFGLGSHLIWARPRASVLNTWISLKQADKKIREANL